MFCCRVGFESMKKWLQKREITESLNLAVSKCVIMLLRTVGGLQVCCHKCHAKVLLCSLTLLGWCGARRKTFKLGSVFKHRIECKMKYTAQIRRGKFLLKEIFQRNCCAFCDKVAQKLSLGDCGKVLLVHKRVRMPGCISDVRSCELVFIKYFDLFQIKIISQQKKWGGGGKKAVYSVEKWRLRSQTFNFQNSPSELFFLEERISWFNWVRSQPFCHQK